MAKKTENPAPEAERKMPVHPDPDHETILLRYPQNGDVKALAKETHKDKKTGHVQSSRASRTMKLSTNSSIVVP